MGARTLIWTLVGLLAIYVAVQLLRIGRQTRSSRSEQGGAAPARIAQTIDDENGGDPAPELAMADADAGDDAFERLAPELRLLRQEVGQLRAGNPAGHGNLKGIVAGFQAGSCYDQSVFIRHIRGGQLKPEGALFEFFFERHSVFTAQHGGTGGFIFRRHRR